MRHAIWNRTVQVQLLSELKGFWAGDLWDMHHSPVETLSPNASQRRLRFNCKSSAINGELKYVCWKKFSGRSWRSTQELTKVHRMIRWLNSMPELPVSLLCRSFAQWQELYRKYLIERGMYTPSSTSGMTRQQEPSTSPGDSQYVSLLRQALILLTESYDTRPTYEKDIWNLKQMGVTTNLSQSNGKLSFLVIRQEWLRSASKSYLKYCLPLYSASTCRTRVQSLACFSDFLAEEHSQAIAKTITRRLLLDYLNYLQRRLGCATSKNHVLNLRNFLEMSHREGWLPIGPERLIHDEEVPRPPKPQPRYLPAAVLDSDFLFPNAKGGVLKQASFSHRINRLAYDRHIRGADGKLFRFLAHQFRHTVGTRMVNLGVPHHIIQRYLGHSGPEMTSRYANIHDSTMRDKLSEYLKGSLVDVTGRTVKEPASLGTSDRGNRRVRPVRSTRYLRRLPRRTERRHDATSIDAF